MTNLFLTRTGSGLIQMFIQTNLLNVSSSPRTMGAQWLSPRVLDFRVFKTHRRHYVVSLNKTQLSLLSTVSTQEDPSRHY